jgi:hypothetical protein
LSSARSSRPERGEVSDNRRTVFGKVTSLEPLDQTRDGIVRHDPRTASTVRLRRSPEEHGRLRPNGYSGLRRAWAQIDTRSGLRVAPGGDIAASAVLADHVSALPIRLNRATSVNPLRTGLIRPRERHASVLESLPPTATSPPNPCDGGVRRLSEKAESTTWPAALPGRPGGPDPLGPAPDRPGASHRCSARPPEGR